MESSQAALHLRCHGEICQGCFLGVARRRHQLSLDKTQVSEVLEEIGTLLELKGENPFKSRAYHNASRLIEGVDNLDALVREKKLTTVKGIGEGLAEKIEILWTTGKLPYLEELRKSLPSGLMDMIRIQGLGPKRA